MATDVAVPVPSICGLRSRFQSGIAFNLIGAVFNQGSTFAFNVIAANLLGRRIFGEYAMVQSTLVTLVQVAQFGCGFAATKYIAEFRSTNKERAGQILGMLFLVSTIAAVLVSLVLFVLSSTVASSILKAADLQTALAIGSGVLFFSSVNTFLVGAMAGLESYRRLAMALGVSGLCYLAVCTGSAWRFGLNGAIAGLLVSALIQSLLLSIALVQECKAQRLKIPWGKSFEEWRLLVIFAIPGAIGGATTMPALWFASALLVRQPDGYYQMGLYSAAFALMSVVVFFPSIANNVAMSVINNQRSQGDSWQYRRTFWMNMLLTGGVALVGASGILLLGPQLLRLFGKSFSEGYLVLFVLMVSTIPQALEMGASQLIWSREKIWLWFSLVAAPRDVMVIFVAYFLVPHYGALGLAASYALSKTFALVAALGINSKIGFGVA